MKLQLRFLRGRRRGTVLVLSAFLMVGLLGMIAFAVDLGYLLVVRTELQTAADSAALAAAQTLGSGSASIKTKAQEFAAYHKAGSVGVTLTNSDVEFGTWDKNTKTFNVSPDVSNAVRITAHRNDTTGGNKYFFARIFGNQSFDLQASAIAMGNPRDICFVVDLSGSMNDDTEACWAGNELNSAGYGSVSTAMTQQIFTDFGYGAAPGTLQWVGAAAGTGVTSSDGNRAYAKLTMNGGYLTGASINATYKIVSGDSEAQRKTKAYKWIIDKQIAVVMPNAKPTPNSATNLAYWTAYLDYLIENTTVNSGVGASPSNRGALPPSQDSDRISGFNNPNTASYDSATTAAINSYRNKIGYLTYVQFMLDFGRNNKPDGTNYTPLSTLSADCPYHNELTAGGTFSFPPSEQPTHAARRSIIAAIQEVKTHNTTIGDNNNKDWVSIVTFDTVAGTVLKTSLTANYDTAMTDCTKMQAVGDNVSSTATETGLIAGIAHIKPASQGGSGREQTNKVVVLLTDGVANLQSSSNSTINTYVNNHSNANFYSSGGNYAGNAALMQSNVMQALGWKMFPVGLGLGTDYGFMDRMARMGSTANDAGQSPRTTGNPSAYETELTNIFKEIITNPEARLVQ